MLLTQICDIQRHPRHPEHTNKCHKLCGFDIFGELGYYVRCIIYKKYAEVQKMCTAVTYKTDCRSYFGRTLDYEFSYGEEIVIMPRNFKIKLGGEECNSHYAIIGMAHIERGYPLFYDALNEKGLAMAGLNFVGNAAYNKPLNGAENVAQYEFISRILCRCSTVREAVETIRNINITDEPFSDNLPAASLHWMIADKDSAVTVESMKNGVNIYDNKVGALTNNPPFDFQMQSLCDYMHLSPNRPKNNFSKELNLECYSRGMGAIGLPGDYSSQSRFVRAAFVRANSIDCTDETAAVSQFFHILGSVEQVKGCCDVGDGKFEYTIYTSCTDIERGIYYYTTYDCRGIEAVDMHAEDLDSDKLIAYPLNFNERIFRRNRL